MKDNKYKKIITDVFHFLQTDYGYSLYRTDDEREYYNLVYKNKTTGVSILYEFREAMIFVYLSRLVNGEIVEDRSPLKKGDQLNSIELRYILNLRNHNMGIPSLFDRKKNLEEIASETAKSLREFANDVLEGDFQVFCIVDEMAKKRRLEWEQSKKSNPNKSLQLDTGLPVQVKPEY